MRDLEDMIKKLKGHLNSCTVTHELTNTSGALCQALHLRHSIEMELAQAKRPGRRKRKAKKE